MRSYFAGFDFISLELPGRGRRMEEGLLTGLDTASRDIFEQISAQQNGEDLLLYGHSMGAVIALKVAGLLEARGIFPVQLVVTGNPGPGVRRDKVRSVMGDREFKNELREIGGMPEEILSNPEMFDFFEPILRADFAVAEGADTERMTVIHAPICAIMGDKEESPDEIDNWRSFTRSAFEAKVVDGGHFFIYDHAQLIATTIKTCYQRYVSGERIRQIFKI